MLRRLHLPILTGYLLHQLIPAQPASQQFNPLPTVSPQQTQTLIAHQHTPLHLRLLRLPQRAVTLPQDQVWTRMARSLTLLQVDSAAYRRLSHPLRQSRRLLG